MNRAVIGGLAALVLLEAASALAATIDVGTVWLEANKADQAIEIRVTPGNPAEQVGGMNLFAQIADAGPDMGGTQDGPEFTGYDLITGTIWEVNPFAIAPSFAPGNQVIIGAVILANERQTVAADGLLATLYVSTAGWSQGEWDLILTQTFDAPLELVDNNNTAIPLDINNGRIIIGVPEPSTVVMLLSLVLAAVPLAMMRKGR